MGLPALRRTVVPLLALGLLPAACATRGSLVQPDFFEDGGTAPDDLGGMRPDVDPLDDVALLDRPDVPSRPACPPYVPPTRAEPCAGRPDCGLPTHGRVDVRGATGPLTNYQVRVELPAAVRAAVGPACDRLVFRTMSNEWAPHWVADCATGVVWVRVPALAAGNTVLAMHYGGATAVPAAQSYDDTFDRVPLQAANLLAAYSFDEGTGSRTCPSGGLLAPPFDAFIHETQYDLPQTEVEQKPPLWSTEAPLSLLNPANATGRFTRNQHSLNFPRHAVLPAAGVASPNRLVNWQSPDGRPFNTATRQLTLGVWVFAASPANAFGDNFQTVVCQGMPDLATRMMVMPDAQVVDNSIFNPWAIFFRSDNVDDTYFQGNSCVVPCTNVDSYAHITTREPLTSAQFAGKWHFMAITVDTMTTPHATRRSFYDDRTYAFPTDLDLFPEKVYCPMGPRMCRWPPEAPIQYYPAPVVIGADMNDGEPQLGLEGRVDDFFVLNRAASPEEIQAYRERRQYSPMAITTAVTP